MVAVRNTVNPAIEYSQIYEIWESLVNANATIDEQLKWWRGGYDTRFIAHLVAFNRARKFINLHSEDAVSKAMEKKAKKARKK